jgi:uncharacterized protein YdeI (YjbR/CyaY-like superfamily)
LVLETLDVSRAADWNSWLRRNHLVKEGVWLVFYRKDSGRPSISYDEAVSEALAFGWIDSIIKKIDEEKFVRKFTPRRPGSVWSKYNIKRIEVLTAEGRMTKWGLGAFAKRTDEISLLERFNAEGVRIPKDLEDALRKNKRAWANFGRFTPSYRKGYLIWISEAKRPETRQKRIAEAVVLISRNVKALLK